MNYKSQDCNLVKSLIFMSGTYLFIYCVFVQLSTQYMYELFDLCLCWLFYQNRAKSGHEEQGYLLKNGGKMV